SSSTGGALPRSRQSLRGPMTVVEEQAFVRYWSSQDDARAGSRSRAGSQAIRLLGGRPDDGQAWLILGHVLEAWEDHAEALRAFQTGLGRLTSTAFDQAPVMIHEALVEALLRVPGHDFRKEWPQLVKFLPGAAAPWEGLYQALLPRQ